MLKYRGSQKKISYGPILQRPFIRFKRKKKVYKYIYKYMSWVFFFEFSVVL